MLVVTQMESVPDGPRALRFRVLLDAETVRRVETVRERKVEHQLEDRLLAAGAVGSYGVRLADGNQPGDPVRSYLVALAETAAPAERTALDLVREAAEAMAA